jgi:hypothetical protein
MSSACLPAYIHPRASAAVARAAVARAAANQDARLESQISKSDRQAYGRRHALPLCGCLAGDVAGRGRVLVLSGIESGGIVGQQR